jgi:solute carrier family 35 protein F1/2
MAEARKPWLGKNQERGVAGLCTAKQRIEHVAPTGSDPERRPSANNSTV